MNRSEILAEADRIINTDRAATHGNAEDSFATIAAFWSAYLHREILPHDVCAMMILLKMARFQNTPEHMDHVVDICGYAAIAGELSKGA